MKLKNKVTNVRLTVFTLVFFLIVMLVCGMILICIGAFYSNVQTTRDRIILYVFGGGCALIGILYICMAMWLLSVYPKHKKLMYLFLKPYLFLPDEEIALRETEEKSEK